MTALSVLSMVTTVYGIAGAMAILFEARKIMARHSSADMSLRFMTTYVGGYALFLAYGLSINSLTLILSDGVGIICGGFTFAVAILYHHGTPEGNQK